MDAAALESGLASGLELFTNWQTVAVGLTIYVTTTGIRRILETWKPKLKTNRWWREVCLPLGPIGNGLLLAVMARKFPWPEQVAQSLSARSMYALVCGLGCGWLYGRFRGVMKKDDAQKATSVDVVSLDSPASDSQGDK